MSVVINNLFFIGNQLAALSTTCKVGVWHATAQNWQVIISWWLYSVGHARPGVSHAMTELAGNSLTVTELSTTGNVGVWHVMTQNGQVILSRWLY